MILRFPNKSLTLLIILSFLAVIAAPAFGRGGFRGGGGFSRGGAANAGSFSRGGGDFSRGGNFSRGGEGGGGYQRSGQFQNEQGGSFDNQGQIQNADGDRQTMSERQSQRQQAASDMQQSDQNQQDKNREDWQDWADDQHWDNHWYGYGNTGAAFVAGTAVGAAATRTYVTTLPCDYTTAFINGSTYYQCGSTWYSRGYVNGNVTYVVVQPPPGF